MLTALGQDDMVVRCLRQGACDYLVKPVRIEDLTAAAANALQHMPLIGSALEVEYDPHGWFEVSGHSDASILYRYRRFLGLLEKFRVAEPAASELRLTLEELGRNAIEWGNKFDKNKKVTFGCRILPGKIIVYIEDEGAGFDPGIVPDPSLDPLAHIQNRHRQRQAPRRLRHPPDQEHHGQADLQRQGQPRGGDQGILIRTSRSQASGCPEVRKSDFRNPACECNRR